MYLHDPREAVARPARLVAPGGLLSILVKNRRAIGVRAVLVGDSGTARRLIVSGADRSVGSLGRETRGDDPGALGRLTADHGMSPRPWQGVRIFHDHFDDAWAPDPAAYAAALEWSKGWAYTPAQGPALAAAWAAGRPGPHNAGPHPPSVGCGHRFTGSNRIVTGSSGAPG
jgi:hypothetical protein